MNDHNLDDLIIDTDTAKDGKAKSILTIIALLIVVMIAAIVLTKIILKDPDAQPAQLEENDVEIVSPELTLQQTTQEKSEEEESLSEITEDEVDAPKEEPVKPQTVLIEEPVKESEEKPSTVVTPVKHTSHPVKEKVTVPQAVTPPTHKSKPLPTPKPKVKKPVPKPKPVANGTFYIQVGSFSKAPTPDSRLITAIRKQGFKHRILTVNGMKKVMVGPYSSRAAANQAIVKVKDLINKSAFIVKK